MTIKVAPPALSANPGMSAEQQPIVDVAHLLVAFDVSERGTCVIDLQLVETLLQGAQVLCALRPSLRELEQLTAELGVVLDPPLDLRNEANIRAVVELLGALNR